MDSEIIKNKEFIIYSKNKQPCIICGKECNTIDIFSESYLCSDICINKFYQEVNEKEKG